MNARVADPSYVIIDGLDCLLLDWNEQVNPITIPSMLPQWDPDWRHTDSQGHEHAPESKPDYAGTLHVSHFPTLKKVMEEPWWCADCKETHSFLDHLVCETCGETVSPGRRPPRSYVIEGQRDITFSVQLGPEEGYQQLLHSNLERNVIAGSKRYVAMWTSSTLSSERPPVLYFRVIKEMP